MGNRPNSVFYTLIARPLSRTLPRPSSALGVRQKTTVTSIIERIHIQINHFGSMRIACTSWTCTHSIQIEIYVRRMPQYRRIDTSNSNAVCAPVAALCFTDACLTPRLICRTACKSVCRPSLNSVRRSVLSLVHVIHISFIYYPHSASKANATRNSNL